MNNGVQENLDFRVLVKQIEGAFVCYIPDLKLIASAPNIEQCYQDVMRQKERLLELYKRSDLLSEIPLPTMGSQQNVSSDLTIRPAGKRGLLVVSAAFLLVILIVGPIWKVKNAINGMQHNFQVASEYMARPSKLYDPLSRMLHDAAYSASLITPERKVQIRNDLRTLVQALKPFADELRPLFAGDSPSPATTTVKKEPSQAKSPERGK